MFRPNPFGDWNARDDHLEFQRRIRHSERLCRYTGQCMLHC